MRELTVTGREAGQRLDKYLARYMGQAPKSFLYQMIRKKNITLNGKRCEGSDRLREGDIIKLFLSDETIEKFMGRSLGTLIPGETENEEQDDPYLDLSFIAGRIIYEDENVLLFDKPAGMLSQKASERDMSAVEYLLWYLTKKGELNESSYESFHPSVCNRLDRNTSGILLMGKTMAGLQGLSGILRDRSAHKDYICLVKGKITDAGRATGYLEKDETADRVRIYDSRDNGSAEKGVKKQPVEIWYRPVSSSAQGGLTRLEVRLVTGRSHQIRAQMAFLGHPLLGDYKYGDREWNDIYREALGIRCQLLHSYRVTFPRMDGELSYLSGRTFTAPVPEIYDTAENLKY